MNDQHEKNRVEELSKEELESVQGGMTQLPSHDHTLQDWAGAKGYNYCGGCHGE